MPRMESSPTPNLTPAPSVGPTPVHAVWVDRDPLPATLSAGRHLVVLVDAAAVEAWSRAGLAGGEVRVIHAPAGCPCCTGRVALTVEVARQSRAWGAQTVWLWLGTSAHADQVERVLGDLRGGERRPFLLRPAEAR